MPVSQGQVAIERNGETFAADFKITGQTITVTYCCVDAGLLRGSTKQLGAFTDNPEDLAERILTEIVSDVIERREKMRL